MTYRLLDLFCGAGGASVGYHRAGFEVTGVDHRPMPRYPYEFIQADAMTFPLDGFDAIHASPPCQRHSKAVAIADRENHPDLVDPTRERLLAAGKPYVMENVVKAPLVNTIRLCGSSFGLPIQRHRLFESNVWLMALPCAHGAYPRIYEPAWNRTTKLRVLSVSGGFTKRVPLQEFKDAMGVDWHMTRPELSEAIPPAYTQFIGEQLIAILEAGGGT